MRSISLDFEFKNSNERNPTVLCCATRIEDEDFLEEKVWWLLGEDSSEFKNFIEFEINQRTLFIAHYSAAECRCLLNYFDEKFLLENLKIIDTYVLWQQLEKDPEISFGIRYENSVRIVSQPPYFNQFGEKILNVTAEYGYYNEETGTTNEDKTYYRTAKHKISRASLVEIVANRLDIDLNSEHKERMRDLILNSEIYSEQEKKEIMEYCSSDIKYLKQLANKLFELFPHSDHLLREQLKVCQWMISTAIIERNGFPVEIDKFLNFCENVDELRKKIIDSCNNVHKFFENYVRKYDLYKDLIEHYKIQNFPTSKSGKYKSDKQTLKDYWAYPEFKKLYETATALSELRYFKNKERILKNIGSDNRDRVMTSPFGTVTTRNAPSVKNGWFLAMSTWMRSLISDERLYGCDYASQEILVMALIAKDKNLQKAYKEGDPYTWFAKQAKLMPQDGNGKKEFRHIRNLCKALLLGIGFGMGNVALAGHLTASRVNSLDNETKLLIDNSKKDDTLKAKANSVVDSLTIIGDDKILGVPKHNQAKYYKNLYTDVFQEVKKYGNWVRDSYKKNGFLKLKDGWTIQHFNKMTTTSNFEIQGNAQVVLREAVRLCILRDIEVVATLHDAIYIMKNKDNDVEILEKCMKEAFMNVLNNDDIRVDSGQYQTDWNNLTSLWTKDRGAEMLKEFGKFFKK
jgi:hypothetical protein